jgi:predicted RecB family endonuclease
MAHKVQQLKSQLEETCSICKEKRSETVEVVKIVASNTIETCEKINNVNKKKWELDSKYEVLEKDYAMMMLSPPF